MQIGVHAHSFISDSADELIDKYFPYYASTMDRIGRERGWSPYTVNQFKGGLSEDGALFMGSPEMVAEKMVNTIQMFGLTRFVAHIDVGGPSHADLMKTIELYGDKVLPLVKKELGEG